MKHKTTLGIYGITILLEVFAYYVFTQIQSETIVIHWNAQGLPDGYGPRWSLFVLVLVLPCVDLLLMGFRKIDPKRKNYEKFDSSFQQIRILLACFFTAFCTITFLAQLYPSMINIATLVSVLCSILFIYLGNMMPKMRRNHFMGIRTPWTISNEIVWQKSQRFSGRLWFYSGFLLLFVSFMPMPFHLILFFGIFMMIAIIPCIYSYLIYHNLKKKGELYD